MTAPVFPADALCAEVGTSAWFPDENDRTHSKWDDARAICLRCPVIEACEEYVMRLEAGLSIEHRAGMWAGKTARQRHAQDRLARRAS